MPVSEETAAIRKKIADLLKQDRYAPIRALRFEVKNISSLNGQGNTDATKVLDALLEHHEQLGKLFKRLTFTAANFSSIASGGGAGNAVEIIKILENRQDDLLGLKNEQQFSASSISNLLHCARKQTDVIIGVLVAHKEELSSLMKDNKFSSSNLSAVLAGTGRKMAKAIGKLCEHKDELFSLIDSNKFSGTNISALISGAGVSVIEDIEELCARRDQLLGVIHSGRYEADALPALLRNTTASAKARFGVRMDAFLTENPHPEIVALAQNAPLEIAAPHSNDNPPVAKESMLEQKIYGLSKETEDVLALIENGEPIPHNLMKILRNIDATINDTIDEIVARPPAQEQQQRATTPNPLEEGSGSRRSTTPDPEASYDNTDSVMADEAPYASPLQQSDNHSVLETVYAAEALTSLTNSLKRPRSDSMVDDSEFSSSNKRLLKSREIDITSPILQKTVYYIDQYERNLQQLGEHLKKEYPEAIRNIDTHMSLLRDYNVSIQRALPGSNFTAISHIAKKGLQTQCVDMAHAVQKEVAKSRGIALEEVDISRINDVYKAALAIESVAKGEEAETQARPLHARRDPSSILALQGEACVISPMQHRDVRVGSGTIIGESSQYRSRVVKNSIIGALTPAG